MKYKFRKDFTLVQWNPDYNSSKFIWQYQNTSKWYTYKEALALVRRSTRTK